MFYAALFNQVTKLPVHAPLGFVHTEPTKVGNVTAADQAQWCGASNSLGFLQIIVKWTRRYQYNHNSGKWAPQAAAVLGRRRLATVTSGFGLANTLALQAGFWNADRNYNTSCVKGRVVYGGGHVCPGAKVHAQGVDGIYSDDTAAADGSFCVDGPQAQGNLGINFPSASARRGAGHGRGRGRGAGEGRISRSSRDSVDWVLTPPFARPPSARPPPAQSRWLAPSARC
jgi:hypothetical protein